MRRKDRQAERLRRNEKPSPTVRRLDQDWMTWAFGMTTPPGLIPDGVQGKAPPRRDEDKPVAGGYAMERETVGSLGRIVSWKDMTEGTTFTGTFLRLRKGKYGDLADLADVAELFGESVTLDAPVGLSGKLADYPEHA